ncbi:hypothetical protein CDL15_Pgr005500 [Punica granatum]|uniref:Uncharacterized protein n=1 Tax=Punica granatum TaxID=22663 RepID=A0A218WVB2_PUNGR|nr:hypothetical protein CDL15_Pgr005500 [Punica granatum]
MEKAWVRHICGSFKSPILALSMKTAGLIPGLSLGVTLREVTTYPMHLRQDVTKTQSFSTGIVGRSSILLFWKLVVVLVIGYSLAL